MKTLILILISISGYSQTAFKITMKMERIPVNSTAPVEVNREDVLIVLEDKNIGIISPHDTLAMVHDKYIDSDYQLGIQRNTYIDVIHNQKYYILLVRVDGKFGIFINPMKPYTRELFAIHLESL